MTSPKGKQPQARYAYLRSDGTAYIVGGSLVAGLGAYAYQLLGGRTLGAEAFSPVSVLLTIHFLIFIVILLPIEQLVVRRLTIDRSRSGLPTRAYWLAGVTMAGATLFAFLGADQYLNGDRRFVLFTALTIGVHFVFAAARGHLAGWRRFRAYGMASGSASLVRLVVAVGVTLVRPSATGFALGLILGPLVVLAWKPFRRVEVDRDELGAEAKEALDDRGLLTGLVLAAASSQALLLVGPLAVGVLGGSAVQISIAFAAFTLGRAPLTFGYNLLARVLPPFTEMAAKGERQELRAWARGMGWAATGLAVIAAGMGWLAGPWVVEVAFGSDFVPSRVTAAAISFGVVFAGGGLFVGQILVARGQSVRLAIAWLSGLVSAAAVVVLTPSLDPITRVAIAFVVGEILALVALVAGAVIVRDGDEFEEDSKAAAAVAKRTLDIAVALVLLVLTIPVVVLAGIAVRINSPGPVFFRQTRLGKRGRPFGMLKIRTMEAGNNEHVFAEHLAIMEASRHSETAPMIRIEEDDRITAVGHFLRRWSIDELPNLWNVLRGPMSLVGPRPLVSTEAEMIGLNNPRFEVKPGITGLAQVEGRDTITMSERTHYDEVYVATRSLPIDIKILIRTFTAVFRESGD
jgi:lipopolysaccharide/colanic/teichoic acid biosynthesis glycosyltransferase